MRRTKRWRPFRRSQNPPGETSRVFRLARSLAIIALFAAAALFGYQFLNGTETVVVSVVGNNIPLEGAVVLAGGSEHITGPDGTVELSIRLPAEIEATALGFHRAITTIDPAAGESTRVALSPIIIHGLVTDPGGKGIPGAQIGRASCRARV